MTIELLEVDCMDYMATQADKAFDLAIVDPPYMKDKKNLNMGTMNGKHRESNYKYWEPPTQEYIAELFRVSKEQIIWGFNYFLELLPNTTACIFWNKHQHGYFSEGELAWCSSGKTRCFDRSFTRDSKIYKIHPTQKPIALYTWCLTHYAQPRQRILDTHLGSGSSAIAAHYHGVAFVGCELDPHYYRLAVQRVNDLTRQIRLAI